MDMPTRRTWMTYIEHMYALEPELRPTGAPVPQKDGSRGRKGKSGDGGRPQKPAGKDPVEVAVIQVREDGGIVFKVDGRRKFITGRFMKGQHFSVGDKVKVRPKRIKNKNGDPIDIYELMV